MLITTLPFMKSGINPASVVYTASYATSATGSPKTISSASIGTASPDRYIFVAVSLGTNGSQADCSAITVAGTACTQIGTDVNSGSNHLSLWRTNSPVSSGTGADIVITYRNSQKIGISIWAVTGLQSTTPTDTDTTTTDAASVTSTVSAGGIIVAAAYSVGLSAGTHTWTGVTEDFDSLSVGANGSVSGGSLNSPGGGNISVSADGTQTSSAFMMIAASFR